MAGRTGEQGHISTARFPGLHLDVFMDEMFFEKNIIPLLFPLPQSFFGCGF